MGRLDGKHAEVGYPPVRYLHQSCRAAGFLAALGRVTGTEGSRPWPTSR